MSTLEMSRLTQEIGEVFGLQVHPDLVDQYQIRDQVTALALREVRRENRDEMFAIILARYLAGRVLSDRYSNHSERRQAEQEVTQSVVGAKSLFENNKIGLNNLSGVVTVLVKTGKINNPDLNLVTRLYFESAIDKKMALNAQFDALSIEEKKQIVYDFEQSAIDYLVDTEQIKI